MGILAIVLLSMRRGTVRTVGGLGSFATANLLAIVGGALLGLRDVIPFAISYFGGNFVTMIGGYFYVAAIRAFDGRGNPRFFFPVFALGCSLAMAVVFLLDFKPARGVLTNVVMGGCATYCCLRLIAQGPARKVSSFNRVFCSMGFLGVATAFFARAANLIVTAPATLFGQPSTMAVPVADATTFYSAIAVTSTILTLGFIMLVNERTHDRLLYLATHDPLTGARTRGSFMELARLAMERSAAENKPLTVLVADLDHFKRINDSFGHQAGDKALRNFVKSANEALRANDVLARYGGEEFVILLPDTDMEGALGIAERLRSITEDRVAPGELSPASVTVSIGVATAGQASADVESLIACADKALYVSKAEGRNRVTAAASHAPIPDAIVNKTS